MNIRILYLLFLLFLFSCHKNYLKEKEDFNHYSLKEKPADLKSNAVIMEYKQKVESETGKIIAYSENHLTREGVQSTLGNFVCDALAFAASKEFKDLNPAIVIVNRGGLRANLPEGDIKVVNIFELMPFDNEMVILRISGEKLLEFISLFEDKKHFFSGLKVTLKDNKVTELLAENAPIERSGMYTLVTSDYLYNGGDRFHFLKDPVSVRSTGLKIRDAIIDYCTYLTNNGKHIIPYTDERVNISK